MNSSKQLMDQFFKEKIDTKVMHTVGIAADELNLECYVVGGYVRDIFLKRHSKDIDFVTVGSGIELAKNVVHKLGKGAHLSVFHTYGTAQVKRGDTELEFVGARKESYTPDSRNPIVQTGTLTDDLSRRDFTINALAVCVNDERFGELIDLFNGQADLQEGILRCVGDPERRFSEDALRILRCLRFAAVLGFSIEPETGKALMTCRNLLREMAPERVHEELTKLLCGPWAPAVLRRYPDVIGAVLPEILPMVGFDQRNPHHCYDVWEHTLHALDAAPPDSVLRWAVLFHDMGKPECFALDTQGIGHFMGHGVVSRRIADGVMDRLRFDNAAKERIGELVEWHDHRVETERGIRRMLNRFGERNFRYLLAIQRADNMGQAEEFRGRQKEIDRIEAMLDRELEKGSCFSLKQLAVNGNDLLGLGLSGPAVGRTLQGLLDRVMDGTLPNDRDALLTAAGKIR